MEAVRICLPQELSRYINAGPELLLILQERYGTYIDFDVHVRVNLSQFPPARSTICALRLTGECGD
jgi:hypothetical protein